MERALEELDRIIDLSPDLITFAGFDGNWKRVNPAFETVLGFTPSEAVGRPFREFVHPDDRDRSAAAAGDLMAGKNLGAFEVRMLCRDGSYRWIEWISAPNLEDELMYAIGRDVTDRRRAEAELGRLADELAALRRVATLVAEEAPPEELFDKVVAEAKDLLGGIDCALLRYEADGTARVVAAAQGAITASFPVGARLPADGDGVLGFVLSEGRPRRIDDYSQTPQPVVEAAAERGFRTAVGCPILARDRVWGAIIVASFAAEPCPPETETRLAQFADLVATAVANAEARAQVERLADEQAALWRVATLGAEDVPAGQLYEAVVREAGTLLGADFAGLARFEEDSVVTVGVWSADGQHPAVPPRWPMQEGDPATTIAEARKATRWNDWTDAPGPIAESIREIGVRSSVGTPIVVEGRLWGALAVHTKQEAPFAPDTESRMAKFTDLVATAITDAEARTEVERLADEQAALRRVATLVAREASQDEIFTAIAEEIARFTGAEEIRMLRYEDDETVVTLAGAGKREDVAPVGSRMPLGGNNLTTRVWRTRKPARIENYTEAASGPIGERVSPAGVRSVVAAPILVEGGLWGAMVAGTFRDEPMPPDTESRISELTELMATAIANTESRTEVERLADEQAALRRVATLVAAGAPRPEIFTAVAAEIGNLFGLEEVRMVRYDDVSGVVVSSAGPSDRFPVGTRVSVDDGTAAADVLRTGEPVRIDDYATRDSPNTDTVVSMGIRSVLATPIRVEGRLWGAIAAGGMQDEPLPPDAESRLGQFTELIATAIANADSRDQLTASRARLVTEGDQARRRVVQDLHDGAQQRLVHTIVSLKLAGRAFREAEGKAESLVGEALEQAQQSHEELRELAHGILPAVLTDEGLHAGVDAVVARLDLPVDVDVPAERFPTEIEASAYFIVAEALTNVVKHACAERAEVRASVVDGMLRVEVRDDGVGGADPDGHGLVGIADRVTALGGQLQILSPPGDGTRVDATFPLSGRRAGADPLS